MQVAPLLLRDGIRLYSILIGPEIVTPTAAARHELARQPVESLLGESLGPGRFAMRRCKVSPNRFDQTTRNVARAAGRTDRGTHGNEVGLERTQIADLWASQGTR